MITNFIDGREAPPAMGAETSELDVVQAIRAAHAAADAWVRAGAGERVRKLELLADRIEARAPELAAREAEESGIALALARADVDRALVDLRRGLVVPPERVPVGVVGVIGARARVIRVQLPRIAALLAAGNVVVVKPSSRAAAVFGEFARLLAEVDFPPGACNIVFGRGETLGRFLVEHPGVPALVVFGRTVTGKAVMVAASGELKRVSLHLGAKNAALVLKDADLDDLVPRLARAAFARGGIDPFALSKILVAETRFDELVARLAHYAREPVRLPHAADVARFESTLALAAADNGKVTGGEIDNSRVVPALVADLTHCSEIHQDELLVPLVTLNPIKYPHEGVKWANTSPYGRAAAVFTGNADLARKLAGQLRVGTVWIGGWHDDAASGDLGPDLKQSGLDDLGVHGTSARVIVS